MNDNNFQFGFDDTPIDLTAGQEAMMWGGPALATMENAEQPQQGQPSGCPFYVQRVATGDEASRFVILLLGNFIKHTAVICAALNSARENDKVDMIIDVEEFGPQGVSAYAYRALLSSTINCKAHVTTYAGTITSMPRTALWLAGDTVTISKCGWVRIEQLPAFVVGATVDVSAMAEEAKTTYKEYADYIVSRKLFTEEDMKKMYEDRGILSLHGQELLSRVAQVNEVE